MAQAVSIALGVGFPMLVVLYGILTLTAQHRHIALLFGVGYVGVLFVGIMVDTWAWHVFRRPGGTAYGVAWMIAELVISSLVAGGVMIYKLWETY